MSHPDADHDSVLADLLEAARAEIRSGTIDVEAWRRRHPEIIDELLPLLETVQNLDTAVSDWKGLDTMAAADAEGGATVDAATAADHQPAESEPLPETIGRYRIIERVGVGGMGTVYKAHDPQLDRIVAVKVPHFHPARKAGAALQRFLREARAAARVRHPHVCPIHDVGEQDGLPYVVMAYIDGQTLADRLRGGARFEDPRAAVALVRQVAEALEAVHGHGIVHRDLKPGNILLEADGRAVLTDFGLARPEQDTENLTDEGVLVGTPAYMPVEQISPGNGTLGPWTDLYSLGVVLYQMLTGRLPYQAGTALDLLLKIGSEEPVPPSRFSEGLDPALEAIVLKMMARRPEDRYPNARALIEALDEWLRTTPSAPAAESTAMVPAAVSTGGAGSPPRTSRRRPLVAAMVVLLLAPLCWFYGGTVIRFATDRGELVIEVDDQDIEVRVVRNGAVVTDRTTRREFTLRAGAGEVEVFEKDGVGPLATKKFTLNRGGRTVVRVTAELAAARRGAVSDAASDFALRFDVGDKVAFADFKPLDPGHPFTLEGFVTPTSARQADIFGDSRIRLQIADGKWLYNYWEKGKNNWLHAGTVVQGKRTHVSLVFAPKHHRIFVDGKLVRETRQDEDLQPGSSAFFIGAGEKAFRGMAGLVDEIRLSKTARYDKDFTPETRFRPDADTIALYHCDEGAGDKLVDASGNGHHGKIFGARWVKADGSEIDAPSPEPSGLTAEQRKALEWVLSVGGELVLTPVGGKMIRLKRGDALPAGKFLLGTVSLAGVKNPADLVEKLSAAPPASHTINLAETNIGDREVAALAALPAFGHTAFWELSGTKVTDAALQRLGRLPNLWGGTFDRTAISDAGVKHLAASTGLQNLNLSRTALTDAGLDHLAVPTHWRNPVTVRSSLNVKGTKVTQAGVEKLARAVPHLRIYWDGGVLQPTVVPSTDPAATTPEQRQALEWVLAVGGNLNVSVNGEGVLLNPGDRLPEGPFEVGILSLKRVKKVVDIVERLRTVPPVQHTIDLSDTNVGDKEVRALAALPAFRRTTYWGLGGTRVTDAALGPLGQLPSLHGGNFDRTAITDAGLKHLAASASLMHLNLEKTAVTDAGLEHLAAPKWWNTLNVKGTKVTQAGVGKLARAVPHLRIHWDGGVIEPTTPADPDRRAADWVLGLGGSVKLLAAGRERTIAAVEELPAGAFQLTELLLHGNKGVDDAGLRNLAGCKNLTSLNLNATAISDAGLIHVKGCRDLKYLGLEYAGLTDSGLAYFKDCENLEAINLGRTQVTDAGLAHLKSTRTLTALVLHGLKVTDGGLAVFQGHENLTHLDLGYTGVTDKGLTHFDHCRGLKMLFLPNTRITDKGLDLLKKFKNLGSLVLTKTKVTAKGIDALRKALPQCRIQWDGGVVEPKRAAADPERRAAEWVLSVGGIVGVRVQGVLRGGIKDMDDLPHETFELVVINLGQNPSVDDTGLANLRNCRNLEQLNLYNSNLITDAGLAHLKGCGSLTHLNLFNCHRVTDAGLAQLRDLTNLTYLHLTQTRVSDAGLVHLRNLENLTVLHLHSTQVSEDGIARLEDLKNLSEFHPPNLSDAGLVRLKAFKSLTKLGLRFNTKVSDAGLAHLKDIKNLAFLSLEDTKLSDAGLVHLKDCKNLRELRVKKTMVTAGMIEELHKALPQCRIQWEGGVVEPAGTSRRATAGTGSAG